MVKVFRSGKNTNKVISILNKLIVKKYLSYDRKRRDLNGIKYWKQVNKNYVPKGYINIGKIVVLQYSGPAINVNISNEIKKGYLTQLSEIFKYIYLNYASSSPVQIKFSHSWNSYITKIKGLHISYNSFIQENLPTHTYAIFEALYEELLKTDWSQYYKFPIHRDLTTDNLVYDYKGRLKIIDFEHFCIGPLEYEFCNSIFWNDDYSINFDVFCNMLKLSNIPIEKEVTYKLTLFYFLDQIDLAYKTDDAEKIDLLCTKFINFIDIYSALYSYIPVHPCIIKSPTRFLQLEAFTE